VTLTLYNTLTRRKEPFRPIDPGNVRMYVCGPTVYDFAHIGNARPVIVFDVLFRLLRHIYGAEHVTYARNITDVDDKINARAAEEYPGLPLNEAIAKVTTKTEKQFHEDIAALGVLPPTFEPRATEFIRRTDNKEDMVRLIETLVQRGHAYVAQDHVLFDVASMPDYGRLSNRSLEEMEAGARVEVAPYKKGPMDFVLWKPSKPGEPSWPSPAGIKAPGRPGWHIECSAMAGALLGDVFDIHGGGIDLVFPHHENEIAQSRCAHGTPVMANVWMHNGFLQVEGEKMSKSLGNFVTINQLLKTDRFGEHSWSGEVLRLAMLMTHYRQPIDWTVKTLTEARSSLLRWAEVVRGADPRDSKFAPAVVAALENDLNTPEAIAELHRLAKLAKSTSANDNPAEAIDQLMWALSFLGFEDHQLLLRENRALDHAVDESVKVVVEKKIAARNAARKAKDFKEADRIRDELSAMGIQLKDSKDSATGVIVTTWEVKR
jgi:cysteinyl-tRNA synthetase